MEIIKRDGTRAVFEKEKIEVAIAKSFASVDSVVTDEKEKCLIR